MKRLSFLRPSLAMIGFLLSGIVVTLIGAYFLFQYLKKDFLTVDWGPTRQHYAVSQNNHFKELWEQSIFAGCMTCVIAANDSIYFVGTLQNPGLMSLTQLDLYTGEVQWQKNIFSDSAALLTVNSHYVLVSIPGGKVASPFQSWDTAQIIAYDSVSGDQVWSEKIPGTRGISTAYIVDESVYVLSGNAKAFQLAIDTGQILNETRLGLLASHDEQTNYFLEFEGLRAIDKTTGESIWFHEDFIYPPPQFSEEIIIAGGSTLNRLGNITALSRRSGEVLWRYENVVSNVAVNDSAVFFLRMGENAVWDGESVSNVQLLVVNMQAGTIIASMAFDPPNITFGSRSFQYNIAVHDDVVAVYLADGRQLITLRFSSDS